MSELIKPKHLHKRYLSLPFTSEGSAAIIPTHYISCNAGELIFVRTLSVKWMNCTRDGTMFWSTATCPVRIVSRLMRRLATISRRLCQCICLQLMSCKVTIVGLRPCNESVPCSGISLQACRCCTVVAKTQLVFFMDMDSQARL